LKFDNYGTAWWRSYFFTRKALMGKLNLARLPSVIGSRHWGCNVLKRDAFDSFGQWEEPMVSEGF